MEIDLRQGSAAGLRNRRSKSRIRRGLVCRIVLLASLASFLAPAVRADEEPTDVVVGEGTPDRGGLAIPGSTSAATGSLYPRPLPRGTPTGIESLLQLPRGFVTTAPRSVAGASQNEWQRRFKTATTVLSEARTALEETKRELDGVAGQGGSSQWSVAPPGTAGPSNTSTSPLSFRLRQQLRGDRDSIESAEKAMRELRIEADLAGVPENWRSAAVASAPRPSN